MTLVCLCEAAPLALTHHHTVSGPPSGHHEPVCPHLVLVVVIVAQSLSVLVQLAHQHLPRAEIKGAEVHLVTKVTG